MWHDSAWRPSVAHLFASRPAEAKFMQTMRKMAVMPERVRRLPRGFGWVDHRLVRERLFPGCSCAALALYLALVTVADNEGLSYWSEGALARLLALDVAGVRRARAELEAAELVAYAAPVWQVLPLKGGVA